MDDYEFEAEIPEDEEVYEDDELEGSPSNSSIKSSSSGSSEKIQPKDWMSVADRNSIVIRELDVEINDPSLFFVDQDVEKALTEPENLSITSAFKFIKTFYLYPIIDLRSMTAGSVFIINANESLVEVPLEVPFIGAKLLTELISVRLNTKTRALRSINKDAYLSRAGEITNDVNIDIVPFKEYIVKGEPRDGQFVFTITHARNTDYGQEISFDVLSRPVEARLSVSSVSLVTSEVLIKFTINPAHVDTELLLQTGDGRNVEIHIPADLKISRPVQKGIHTKYRDIKRTFGFKFALNEGGNHTDINSDDIDYSYTLGPYDFVSHMSYVSHVSYE
jgi:hypothetical protein